MFSACMSTPHSSSSSLASTEDGDNAEELHDTHDHALEVAAPVVAQFVGKGHFLLFAGACKSFYLAYKTEIGHDHRKTELSAACRSVPVVHQYKDEILRCGLVTGLVKSAFSSGKSEVVSSLLRSFGLCDESDPDKWLLPFKRLGLWLHGVASVKKEVDPGQVFEIVGRNGHLHLLRYAKLLLPDGESPSLPLMVKMMEAAMESGCVKTLDFLVDAGWWGKMVMVKVEKIQTLRQRVQTLQSELTGLRQRSHLRRASLVLRMQMRVRRDLEAALYSSPFDTAVQSGHVAVLEWGMAKGVLCAQRDLPRLLGQWGDASVVEALARAGACFDPETMRWAGRYGNIGAARALRAASPSLPWIEAVSEAFFRNQWAFVVAAWRDGASVEALENAVTNSLRAAPEGPGTDLVSAADVNDMRELAESEGWIEGARTRGNRAPRAGITVGAGA
uniref:Uncharacterized protein n=1 Tax=Chromera velia CCMP2878 TaxID=1169474 RepID=A0A0G4HRR7_9ALVE|mmetsp:Transcript_34442/g.68116  ORF Transcript_34442/g.68116 Transcript_34442/m.68116 type:complete len:446 (-) Transcript_34442:1245-2582(-)|eukprot:Cvel_30715.t1-p1 / transcript=Cvel_30715.t1 / gene=Cvel_30715 / organism=Chromera_velia_CCMP2878 / gene_product=hypothetical protein / transcript_product=hypothetical protein / location=Cvel_scaffold4432:6388-9054(-) / protein_length=445 / sequence_SO=supercontig / SO=protein_coding / is_pseudo=false